MIIQIGLYLYPVKSMSLHGEGGALNRAAITGLFTIRVFLHRSTRRSLSFEATDRYGDSSPFRQERLFVNDINKKRRLYISFPVAAMGG